MNNDNHGQKRNADSEKCYLTKFCMHNHTSKKHVSNKYHDKKSK